MQLLHGSNAAPPIVQTQHRRIFTATAREKQSQTPSPREPESPSSSLGFLLLAAALSSSLAPPPFFRPGPSPSRAAEAAPPTGLTRGPQAPRALLSARKLARSDGAAPSTAARSDPMSTGLRSTAATPGGTVEQHGPGGLGRARHRHDPGRPAAPGDGAHHPDPVVAPEPEVGQHHRGGRFRPGQGSDAGRRIRCRRHLVTGLGKTPRAGGAPRLGSSSTIRMRKRSPPALDAPPAG